jgi:acetolactate synthase small subunit
MKIFYIFIISNLEIRLLSRIIIIFNKRNLIINNLYFFKKKFKFLKIKINIKYFKKKIKIIINQIKKIIGIIFVFLKKSIL